ncbi:hypothetical protein DFH08DRAFT_959063 [Mycena albidolilacea]|uniref:Uncharacterized protein n=1 Tax=Mycena albidolilacea TaxID=1033008 RepID=A0AAD7A3I6_9AGAR|nr:hypothetical protein DFH08DRAFT_959063 [Mycena albidolilacea]
MDKVASRSSSDPEKNVDSSSLGSDQPLVIINDQLERTVWRKLDIWVLPIVTLFYLLSFLDRTNIGNAKVAGLLKDLKMTPQQYSIALTVTYMPYIAARAVRRTVYGIRPYADGYYTAAFPAVTRTVLEG